MTYIDVFNGDADGICALHQLRLANPQPDAQLITGVKRDIKLLSQVNARPDDQITVLDISLDKNREALIKNLDNGAQVLYFDHHVAGDIPNNKNLQAHINTSPTICTSLLVNNYLNNQYLAWAVTAAYGDNLYESAEIAAKPLELDETQLSLLKELGTYINYNGYGPSLDDLFYPPEKLYHEIKPYINPFAFIHESKVFSILKDGYTNDMHYANELTPSLSKNNLAVFILPNEKWAKRVSGVYANLLAQQSPQRAHAILTTQENNNDSTYLVSVRAPLETKTGADSVCCQFETGGGRKAAAGINHLPLNEYDRFISVFSNEFNG